MKLEDAYKLKGYALTQIEIWQSKVREANVVINASLSKLPEVKPEEPAKKEEGVTNENHCGV